MDTFSLCLDSKQDFHEIAESFKEIIQDCRDILNRLTSRILKKRQITRINELKKKRIKRIKRNKKKLLLNCLQFQQKLHHVGKGCDYVKIILKTRNQFINGNFGTFGNWISVEVIRLN